MAMTIEQVRDTLREEAKFQRTTEHHVTCMVLDKLADAIDAQLSQPAQAVDVGAIREVIAEIKSLPDSEENRWMTSPLTRAIGTAQGWFAAEWKSTPEHQTDMLLARTVLREVIVPPAPTPPTDGEG